MKTAKELYKSPSMAWDYSPILDNVEGEIVLHIKDDDYQGDSFVLYKKDDKFGYLTFGWGSCSGCDALQACNTYEEIQELMDSLYNSIQWFDDYESFKNYMADTSIQELKFSWHSKSFHKFRKLIIEEDYDADKILFGDYTAEDYWEEDI